MLDAEIARVVALGVDVELDHTVHDIEQERRGRIRCRLPGRRCPARPDEWTSRPATRPASSMPCRSFTGSPTAIRRCSGGGWWSTAVETLHSTRPGRLAASAPPTPPIVYRRNRGRMPADGEELEEALGEGVTMRWLSTVSSFEDGRLILEKMRLNEQGFPEPTGEFEELDADSLVLALGQDTDLSLLDHAPDVAVEDGVVEVVPTMMTGEDGVFAGGDTVPSERTATIAIGHGKRAACGIDSYVCAREPVEARTARRWPRSID